MNAGFLDCLFIMRLYHIDSIRSAICGWVIIEVGMRLLLILSAAVKLRKGYQRPTVLTAGLLCCCAVNHIVLWRMHTADTKAPMKAVEVTSLLAQLATHVELSCKPAALFDTSLKQPPVTLLPRSDPPVIPDFVTTGNFLQIPTKLLFPFVVFKASESLWSTSYPLQSTGNTHLNFMVGIKVYMQHLKL